MSRFIVLASAAACMAVPTSASAQDICSKFSDQYDNLSKTLAYNFARGIADNSAPRAAVREAEENGALLKAQLLVELMKAKGCELPDHVPDMIFYLGSAQKCRLALMGRSGTSLPPQCDRETWRRMEP